MGASTFLGHSGLQRRRKSGICAKTHPSLTPVMAKKKRPSPPPKKEKSSTESFAGMAAGPGAPVRKSSTPLTRKKDGENEVSSAEDGDDNAIDAEASRATRALGTKKVTTPPKLETRKTAADFIAEGVVDDMDSSDFIAEDIRFGIDDVLDPFKEDDAAENKIRKESEAESERANIGKSINVTGDGGVKKQLVTPGNGDVVYQGAEVNVQYTGTLEDGTTFDSSRSRSGGFSFELGAGRVIKGWEAGVATMRKGEVSTFEISPQYAYGRRGMPPVIPGSSTLTFEIELVDFRGGEQDEIKKVSDFNPEVARTPEEIAKNYDARLETQEERRKNMSLLERFYIISPFASQTGERPPWWINPNITSFIILAFCGVGFYLVVLSGAVHIGYVDQPVDVNIFK